MSLSRSASSLRRLTPLVCIRQFIGLGPNFPKGSTQTKALFAIPLMPKLKCFMQKGKVFEVILCSMTKKGMALLRIWVVLTSSANESLIFIKETNMRGRHSPSISY